MTDLHDMADVTMADLEREALAIVERAEHQPIGPEDARWLRDILREHFKHA